ncbi:MAG: hypothetical protein KME28_09685 [Pelatocladus maniniholoensis HA4357-MV3]|jgi:hypothetical protein|uniref:Uncharacterized protein n=1 Tax=Pelatocladus maniniholoensis HA4357-MV3 TaxID=1117104 RepID=A0A9E3H6T0_9NOST|nr:hypothetical protein [Pelatocladus maniniholoensis HA4357-MV3]
MEPLVTIATVIVTLIFNGVFEGLGQDIEKGTTAKITQLIAIIREKFKASETEVLLTRAEKQPTELNIAAVKTELVTQMSEDKVFAQKLADLLRELESNKIIRHVMASNIKAKSLEAKDMHQIATSGSSVELIMGCGLEIEGDVKFGNLTQES